MSSESYDVGWCRTCKIAICQYELCMTCHTRGESWEEFTALRELLIVTGATDEEGGTALRALADERQEREAERGPWQRTVVGTRSPAGGDTGPTRATYQRSDTEP